LYRRTGTVWSHEAYVKASNTGQFDSFGFPVAVDGNTLVVGAPFEDSNQNQALDDLQQSGAAYVFERKNGLWKQTALLKASNRGSGDLFGSSIAIEGDTIVVGAPEEPSDATGINGDQNNDDANSSGAVYVFRKQGGGLWKQEAYIKASNTGAFDFFGQQVALSGDLLAVSAPEESSSAIGVNPMPGQQNNSVSGAGAVYLYRRTGDTWLQHAYIKASNPGPADFFGGGIALSGDTLVVGAWQEDSAAVGVAPEGGADDDSDNAGAVYVFH
jgi:hypothetical protein